MGTLFNSSLLRCPSDSSLYQPWINIQSAGKTSCAAVSRQERRDWKCPVEKSAPGLTNWKPNPAAIFQHSSTPWRAREEKEQRRKGRVLEVSLSYLRSLNCEGRRIKYSIRAEGLVFEPFERWIPSASLNVLASLLLTTLQELYAFFRSFGRIWSINYLGRCHMQI